MTFALFRPKLVAKAKVISKAHAKPESPSSVAALQELERVHVMKCAKEITGSDKPRKLAPEMRKKVDICDFHADMYKLLIWLRSTGSQMR